MGGVVGGTSTLWGALGWRRAIFACCSEERIGLILAWLAVGLPLLWGVVQTMKKALALFH